MNEARRGRVLHRIAWACVVLMLLVVGASAWLRLAQPRPACSDWPACAGVGFRAVVPAQSPAAAPSAANDAVRALHRTSASLVLLASLAMAWLALGRQPQNRAAGGMALALIVIALLLAVLGIVTPGARSRAVLLGNLLGGHLMLGLAWRLLRQLQSPPPLPVPASRIVALLWVSQAALGALTAMGGFAAGAHWTLASVALLLMAWTGWNASIHGRVAEGRALMALSAAQVLLGTIAVVLASNSAISPAVVLLHNLGAATALAVLFGLMPTSFSRRPAQT